MKLKIKEGSENYCAIVVKVKELYPIEGADRIRRAVILGNNVIVGNTVNEGDELLYFTSGTKLNKQYCVENNLLENAALNKDKVKGYLSSKRLSVKAIKLKGVVSNGMLMPLNSLTSIGVDYTVLKAGDTFTGIGEIELCEKYVPPVKTNTSSTGKKRNVSHKVQNLIVENQFRFHYNTPHFNRHSQEFKPEDVITVTRKRHGSSLILSNVLVNKKLSLIDKLLRKVGVKIPSTEYGYIWSSGKPKGKKPKGIESPTNKWETPNKAYYTKDIWLKSYHELRDKVEKGISIYAEITGEGIQGNEYTYGKEFAIHVYRITQTNADGLVYEFGWNEVKMYCDKYDIPYVEEFYNGSAVLLNKGLLKSNDFSKEFSTVLQESYLDKEFFDCKVDEGVCIRKENQIYKLKSPNFIFKESKNREEGKVDKEDTE